MIGHHGVETITVTMQQGVQAMLNPQSPIPLYRQLADILLAGIRSGAYPPDSRIPSEHVLASTYGIGRPTARQAVDFLVRRRLLFRKRGAGTFVRADSMEVDLLSLAGTTSAFLRKGLDIHTHLLEMPRLSSIAPDSDNPFSGRSAYTMSRLVSVEDTPVLMENTYLDAAIFAGIDAVNMENQSLSKIVDERYFMRPVRGTQHFSIGYAEGAAALHLNVSTATPILVVKRCLHFSNAENAIYAELYCRTDRFVFSQTISLLPGQDEM